MLQLQGPGSSRGPGKYEEKLDPVTKLAVGGTWISKPLIEDYPTGAFMVKHSNSKYHLACIIMQELE